MPDQGRRDRRQDCPENKIAAGHEADHRSRGRGVQCPKPRCSQEGNVDLAGPGETRSDRIGDFQAERLEVIRFGKSRARLVADKVTGVCFDDVAGCDEAKYELQEVVDFL